MRLRACDNRVLSRYGKNVEFQGGRFVGSPAAHACDWSRLVVQLYVVVIGIPGTLPETLPFTFHGVDFDI